MLTLDSSGIFAVADKRERHHQDAVRALKSEAQPHIVPAGILGEVCFLLEQRGGHKALDAFLGDLERGIFTLYCGEDDIGRARALVDKFSDLPLGYADAAVIACAERNGGKVLTLDRRDFEIVARDVKITLFP